MDKVLVEWSQPGGCGRWLYVQMKASDKGSILGSVLFYGGVLPTHHVFPLHKHSWISKELMCNYRKIWKLLHAPSNISGEIYLNPPISNSLFFFFNWKGDSYDCVVWPSQQFHKITLETKLFYQYEASIVSIRNYQEKKSFNKIRQLKNLQFSRVSRKFYLTNHILHYKNCSE